MGRFRDWRISPEQSPPPLRDPEVRGVEYRAHCIIGVIAARRDNGVEEPLDRWYVFHEPDPRSHLLDKLNESPDKTEGQAQTDLFFSIGIGKRTTGGAPDDHVNAR